MSDALSDMQSYADAVTRLGQHETASRPVGTKATAHIHVGKEGVVIAVVDSFGRLTAGLKAARPEP